MGNTLLNISMITNESLMQLKNNLVFADGVNKQYSDQFAKKGGKIGSVVNIRKPVRFDVTNGKVLNLQDVDDQSVALTVDSQKHVAFQFYSEDMALSIDEFSDRYLKPAGTRLANEIDKDGLAKAKSKIWNYVGTPGTQPSSADAALTLALNAGAILDENGAPMDELRRIVLNPASQVAMVKGLSGLYNSQEKIGEQYKKGSMIKGSLGFDWYMGQNVAMHTTGAVAGAPAIDTGSTASTLHLDGITGSISGCYKAGDVIEIEDVFAVNPQTKESTGRLMKFVVTADTDSNAGEIAALPISPSIVTSGPYQNVSRAPADGDLVYLFGAALTYASKTSPVNIAYHKDAFALAMVDLPLPDGVDKAARAVDKDGGFSLRIVKDYDIHNDRFPCRVDVLYGWEAIYPELSVRIQC